MSNFDDLFTSADILDEAIDFSALGSFINSIRDKANYLVTGNTRRYFRAEDYRKYLKLKNMNLLDYKVSTYPNIYMYVKFKVSSPVLFDYVIEKIKYSAKFNAPFNPEAVRLGALGAMYKALTGKFMGDMEKGTFRDLYRMFVFGGYNKIETRIRPDRILNLMYGVPNVIHYVEYNLLGNQLKNLNLYADKLSKDLDRLALYNPELSQQVPLYKKALRQAVDDIINIFKIVKSTLLELNDEYYRIMEHVYKMVYKEE